MQPVVLESQGGTREGADTVARVVARAVVADLPKNPGKSDCRSYA